MTVTRGSLSVLAGMLEGSKSDDEVDFAAATGEIAQFHFPRISPHLLQALSTCLRLMHAAFFGWHGAPYPSTIPRGTLLRGLQMEGIHIKELPHLGSNAIFPVNTNEKPLKKNSFLVWEGGKPADFELRFKYKIIGGNSGVRSWRSSWSTATRGRH